MHTARGYSLIELVIIIVVLGIAGAFFVTMFTQMPRSLGVDENAQTGSQLAQACSEQILAMRRGTVGYGPIASGSCASLPVLAGYTVSDVVDPAYAGAACPLAGACKQVTVTVNAGAVNVAQTTFLLVNY